MESAANGSFAGCKGWGGQEFMTGHLTIPFQLLGSLLAIGRAYDCIIILALRRGPLFRSGVQNFYSFGCIFWSKSGTIIESFTILHSFEHDGSVYPRH
jgi:hypothetical protein